MSYLKVPQKTDKQTAVWTVVNSRDIV